MSSTEDMRAAREQLASRLTDMQAFLGMDDAAEGADELGSVFDYGLEWAKDSMSWARSTVTYRHVISTGGPHEQFDVTFGRNEHGYGLVIDSITFVSLPWFGRVEIPLSGDDLVTAEAFYESFFADDCDEDFDA